MSKTKLTRIEKNWVLYDVANSAFTLLIATILPIFSNAMALAEGKSANDATVMWSYVASLSTLIFVFAGPILGSIADHKGQKKKLFLISLIIGVIGCAVMGFAPQWTMFLVLFFIAKVGYNASLIFYDSMLTDITTDDRMDEISSLGYALGYIGSCVPFIAGLAFVLLSQMGILPISLNLACTLALIICAAWWILLSTPLLKTYKQKYFVESDNKVRDSFKQLGRTFKSAKKNKATWMFLLAFFFYIDGVYTIIEIATPYGLSVGIDTTQLLLALLLTQFVAFPCAILFGKLAKKFPTRSLLEFAVLCYLGIAVFAFQLDKVWEFWVLATMVGMVQGGIQALSRSYFAKLVPKEHSNEFFGFYDIFGKSASVLGTFVMGFVTQISDKPNLGIIPIALMFVIGFVILKCVPKNAADEKMSA